MRAVFVLLAVSVAAAIFLVGAMSLGCAFGLVLSAALILAPPPFEMKHFYTLAAALPAAALLCFVLSQAGPGLVGQLHQLGAAVGGIVEGFSQLARPLSNIGVVTLLDVECMTLFVVCCYGVSVVLHHLVDIARILKVSRRRATQW
jgi:hypothetical protein